MRFLPLLLLISGCYVGPKYKLADGKKTCAFDFVERENDLAVKLDAGPGDGSFDYDVLDWVLLDHTTGYYDLKTGDFWWDNTYATGAIREREQARGVGFVSRSGDLDLDYKLTAVFKDGTFSEHQVRHKRVGCEETIRVENLNDEDDIVLTDATWISGALDWERNFVEGPVPVVGVGRMTATRAWAETVDFDQGGIKVQWYSEGDGNGHVMRTFDDNDGFDKVVGSWERWFDGTVAMTFTRNNASTTKQDWDFSVDPDGNGGGTWANASDTCEISFSEGKCRLKACSNENLQGVCQVPVTWPRF